MSTSYPDSGPSYGYDPGRTRRELLRREKEEKQRMMDAWMKEGGTGEPEDEDWGNPTSSQRWSRVEPRRPEGAPRPTDFPARRGDLWTEDKTSSSWGAKEPQRQDASSWGQEPTNPWLPKDPRQMERTPWGIKQPRSDGTKWAPYQLQTEGEWREEDEFQDKASKEWGSSESTRSKRGSSQRRGFGSGATADDDDY